MNHTVQFIPSTPALTEMNETANIHMGINEYPLYFQNLKNKEYFGIRFIFSN